MRRTVVGLLAGMLSLGAVAVAAAADMPTKAPVYKAPAVVAPYNWTGCYVGANVGGAWARSHDNIPAYPASFDINTSSVIGGAQVGCNYMFPERWVVGIEGDWDWMSLKGDNLTTAGAERYFVKWNSLGTLRGRLGYAWDRTLFYVTGGGAWAHLSAANYIPTAFADQSATYSGWTAGLGVEYALTQNWIVGAEYLHAGFGSKNFVYAGPNSVDNRIDLIRARVSFKF